MSANTRRDRQRRDRELRRAAANRRIGHDHAYLIVAGPYLGRLLAAVVLAVGLAVMWIKVDHHRIALVAGALGILAILIWTAWFLRAGTLRARMMATARGERASPWWHGLAAAGLCLIVAAYLLYQP